MPWLTDVDRAMTLHNDKNTKPSCKKKLCPALQQRQTKVPATPQQQPVLAVEAEYAHNLLLQIQCLENEAALLRSSFSESRRAHPIMKQESENMVIEITRVNREACDLKFKKSLLETDNHVALAERVKLEKEVNALIDQKERSRHRVLDTLTALKKECSCLKNKIEAINSDMCTEAASAKDLENKAAEMLGLARVEKISDSLKKSTVDFLENMIRRKEMVVSNLTKELHACMNKEASLRSHICYQKQNLKDARSDLMSAEERLKEEKGHSEVILKAIKDRQSDKAGLDYQLDCLRSEIGDQTAEREAGLEKIRNLKTDLAAINAENDILQSEMGLLSNLVHSIESKVNDLKTQLGKDQKRPADISRSIECQLERMEGCEPILAKTRELTSRLADEAEDDEDKLSKTRFELQAREAEIETVRAEIGEMESALCRCTQQAEKARALHRHGQEEMKKLTLGIQHIVDQAASASLSNQCPEK